MIWVFVLTLFVVLRFTIFANLGGNGRFMLCGAFMFSTFLIAGSASAFEGRRQYNYLKLNYPTIWRYLTEAKFAPWLSGRMNGFRLLPWIFTDSDSGDENIRNLKYRYKYYLTFILFIFFAQLPINAILF